MKEDYGEFHGLFGNRVNSFSSVSMAPAVAHSEKPFFRTFGAKFGTQGQRIEGIAEHGCLEGGCSHTEWNPEWFPPRNVPFIRGQSVFGGMLSGRIGHFLLESLSRFWAYGALDAQVPIFFLAFKNTLTPFQRDIFELLGLDSRRVQITREPLRFEALHVPEPGFVISSRAASSHLTSLGRLSWGLPNTRRIWISRSRWGKEPPSPEEIALERELARLGWEIFHPEVFPVVESLSRLLGCATLAGLEGSFFHVLLLYREPRWKNLALIPRKDSLNRNYKLVSEALCWSMMAVTEGTEYDPMKARRLVRDPIRLARRLNSL